MAATAEHYLAPPIPNRRGRVSERTVLLVASFGAFLAFLDATIVNVAFPSIRAVVPGLDRSRACPGSSTPTTSSSRRSSSSPAGSPTWSAGGGRSPPGCSSSPPPPPCAPPLRRWGSSSAPGWSRPSAPPCWYRRRWPWWSRRSPGERRSHAVGLWGASAAAGLRARAADRRRARRGGWLALGVPRQPAVRPRRAVGRHAACSWRAGPLVGAGCPTSRVRCCRRGDAGPADARHRQGQRLGLDQLAGPRLLRRGRRAVRLDSSQLAAPPLTAARPRPAADPVVRRGQPRDDPRRHGFLRLPADEHPLAAVRLGLLGLRAGLALVPGALVAAVLAGRARAGRRASAGTGWSSSRRAGLGAAPTSGTPPGSGSTPDFLGQWLPGQVLSGLGVGATLPVLGSAALAAVPGGRFATASAVNSERPPDRRRARHRDPRGHHRDPVTHLDGAPPSGTAGCSRPSASSPSRSSPPCVGRVVPSTWRAQEVEADPSRDGPDPDRSTGCRHRPRRRDRRRCAPLLRPAAPARPRGPGRRRRFRSTVAAGDWLFHAGDDGRGSLRRAGRTPGGRHRRRDGCASWGRAPCSASSSLLTGGVRSASVRARRDSHLLRVSHAAFARITSRRRRRVASGGRRARRAAPAASHRRQVGTPQPRVVAVVALGAGAPVRPVAEALAREMARSLRVATPWPGRTGRPAARRARPTTAWSSSPTSPRTRGGRCAPGRPTTLVLVARSDDDVPAGPPLGRTGADLVLVGPRPGRDRLRAWADALRAVAACHATPRAPRRALAPLAARIAGRSLGWCSAVAAREPSPTSGCCRSSPTPVWQVDRIAGLQPGARSSLRCTRSATTPTPSTTSATRSSSGPARSATTPCPRCRWPSGKPCRAGDAPALSATP